MSITVADPLQALAPFSNEPVTDFSQPANRQKMAKALDDVRSQLGREYELLVAGRRVKTSDQLRSLNPSRPSEVIGTHHKASAALANEAVESAFAFFPE